MLSSPVRAAIPRCANTFDKFSTESAQSARRRRRLRYASARAEIARIPASLSSDNRVKISFARMNSCAPGRLLHRGNKLFAGSEPPRRANFALTTRCVRPARGLCHERMFGANLESLNERLHLQMRDAEIVWFPNTKISIPLYSLLSINAKTRHQVHVVTRLFTRFDATYV